MSHKLEKYLRSSKAVNNASLEIRKGVSDVIRTIRMRKEHFLRVVAGLKKPSDGNVYFNGNLVNNFEPQERNVAMVFQECALYPHMSQVTSKERLC